MHSTKESDNVKEVTCKEEPLVNQVEKRRVQESEDEEEELDEFGRVKRRRQKFKSERDPAREEGEYDDEDDIDEYQEDRYARHRYRSRHRESSPYRRRSSSRHRSSSRRRRSSSRRSSYHRSSSRYGYSGSESDDDDYYRRRRRSSYHRDSRYHNYYRGRSRDTYDHAGRYIDTEFYSTKVYIGDLEGVSRDGLERAFSRYGSIREIKMVEGKDYAFVTFEDKTSALDAIQSMHGVQLGARNIKVNRAKIPERNQVGFGNVPWTDEDGNLAKEEMQSYPASRDMLPLSTSGEDLNTQPPVGRALTSYDDL